MKKKHLKTKVKDLKQRLEKAKPKIVEIEEKISNLDPSTKIRLDILGISCFAQSLVFFKISNPYNKEENKAIINKRIAETIDKYGLIKFEGTNLYDIESVYELKNAIILIENGMVDYYHKKQSKLKYYYSDALSLKERYADDGAIDKEGLSKKAREKAGSQEEYDCLRLTFISYAEEKLFFTYIEREIRDCIEVSGIDKYIGTSLWEITDFKLYQEAMEAIEKMHRLKKEYGITVHNGTPIEELSNYELDGILQSMPVKQKRKKAA